MGRLLLPQRADNGAEKPSYRAGAGKPAPTLKMPASKIMYHGGGRGEPEYKELSSRGKPPHTHFSDVLEATKRTFIKEHPLRTTCSRSEGEKKDDTSTSMPRQPHRVLLALTNNVRSRCPAAITGRHDYGWASGGSRLGGIPPCGVRIKPPPRQGSSECAPRVVFAAIFPERERRRGELARLLGGRLGARKQLRPTANATPPIQAAVGTTSICVAPAIY